PDRSSHATLRTLVPGSLLLSFSPSMLLVARCSAVASMCQQPPLSVFFDFCRPRLVITTDDAEQNAGPVAFQVHETFARQRELFVGAVIERLDQEQGQRGVDVCNRIVLPQCFGELHVLRV